MLFALKPCVSLHDSLVACIYVQSLLAQGQTCIYILDDCVLFTFRQYMKSGHRNWDVCGSIAVKITYTVIHGF